MFFFSSRRRHTRYWRDWSSDVCSSDLTQFKGNRRRFTIKPYVLLLTTLQISFAALIFWLAVLEEQVATCASKFQVLFRIFHGMSKPQSCYFSWERGANNCFVVAWCKTDTNCGSCEIFSTNRIHSCELNSATVQNELSNFLAQLETCST